MSFSFSVCAYNTDDYSQNLGFNADVYCLQGEKNINNSAIQDLKNNAYEIVYLKSLDAFANAIALNTTVFTNIKNHSYEVEIPVIDNKYVQVICKEDVAIATAMRTSSDQRITFASLQARSRLV